MMKNCEGFVFLEVNRICYLQALNDSCSFCDKYGSGPQVVDLDGASPDESDVGSHSRTKDT